MKALELNTSVSKHKAKLTIVEMLRKDPKQWPNPDMKNSQIII